MTWLCRIVPGALAAYLLWHVCQWAERGFKVVGL